eukprot:gene6472-6700_t
MTGPGAGDIAHVYLLDLGPDLSHEDVDYVTYDDATQQLLVAKGGHVFAYDVSKGPVGDTSLRWMYPLQCHLGLFRLLLLRMTGGQHAAAGGGGGGAAAAGGSASCGTAAVSGQPPAGSAAQPGNAGAGMCFVHSIHKGRGDILTFFFTDAPDTDLVIVTSRAAELTQFAARLELYRFYTDTIMLQHVYQLCSPQHMQPVRVVHAATAREIDSCLMVLSIVGNSGTGHLGDVYEASDLAHSPSWQFFTPGLVLDTSSCSMGRLQLDLRAVADSAADWPTLTGFLLRRRGLPPAAPLAADPRKLLMQCDVRCYFWYDFGEFSSNSDVTYDYTSKEWGHEGHGVVSINSSINSVFGLGVWQCSAVVLLSMCHGAAWLRLLAAAEQRLRLPYIVLLGLPFAKRKQHTVSVLTPNELARDLFKWVHDEEVVDALYLQVMAAGGWRAALGRALWKSPV